MPDVTTQAVALRGPLPTRPRSGSHWVRRLVVALLLPLAILLLWHLASSSRWVAPYLLPKPVEVLDWLVRLTANGQLATHLGVSFGRAMTGFAIGVSLATILGVLSGYLLLVRNIIDPT